MKARILPLADLAEFGKTGAVALMVTITPEEARAILRDWDQGAPQDFSPAVAKALYSVLGVIGEANKLGRAEALHEVINSDGRTVEVHGVGYRLTGDQN
jgi:hypothetical protein